MSEHVENITIVGGGSAGWLLGLVMISTLNAIPGRRNVNVTLIESPNVPTVGVGEATVPAIYNLFKQLKIDETEFFRRTNATFKCSGRFENWNLDKDGKPLTFVNPFNTGGFLKGFNSAYHYLKFGPQYGGRSFADCMLPTQAIVEQAKGPKFIGSADYDFAMPYTYHLDAKLMAEFLREVAISRGIKHIQDDVIDIEQREDGFISRLKLKEHGYHDVEFVIDCSGFKGLILQQTLKEPFIPYDKYLLCDRAVPIMVPHKDVRHIEPCTTSHALSAGWAWKVPLYHREGTGYVFSSQFLSDDQAIDELLQHLGDRAPKDIDPRVIHMRIGRVRNPWVKNCVAAGLAAGFVEPLEATAIFTIEMTARWLLTYFPDKECSAPLVNRFNNIMNQMYDEILSFIVMNYYTSNRQEPFWLAARNDIVVPDKLQENLELWKYSLPTRLDTADNFLFQYWDYIYVLFGKQYFDNKTFPIMGFVGKQEWMEYSRQLAEAKQAIMAQLPDHYELLTSIRNKGQQPGKSPNMQFS